MEETKNNAFLGIEKESKLLLQFALPCVLSLIIQSLYNLVDQIFIGHCETLGAIGNAATGIVFPLTLIALGLGLWLGDGTAALLSINQGKGDTHSSSKSVGTALSMGIIVSIVMMGICIPLKNNILQFIGAGGNILEKSSEYANFIFGGLLFFILASVINPIIRADGSPKYAMAAMAVGALINIALDPLFIFAFDMGMTGAALATFLGQTVTFIMNVAYLFKAKTFRLSLKDFIPDGKLFGMTAQFGVSSALTQFAIVIVSVVTNIQLLKYSASSGYDVQITQGVLTLAFKIFGIVVSIIVGIACGGQPILGYNYGARKMDRVRNTMKYILLSAAVVGIISTLIFEFVPDIFLYIFGSGGSGVDPVAYKIFMERVFRIYMSAICLTCVLKSIAIFFQATGQPVKSTAICLCRDVFVLVTVTVIFCNIGGINLFLWAGPVADVCGFVLAVILYAHFLSKNTKQEAAAVSNREYQDVILSTAKQE
ncbi:MAG: MATE family efflux transporter [Bacteroidales bacterium]|nr:MATE family efflux transporter [Bacteroidales bacterium]MDD3202013.1 MATE family efflux transporter [Bacteroidales bacterium]